MARILGGTCAAIVVLAAAHASAAVVGYEVLSSSIAPSTTGIKSLLVQCPEGKVALGGGTTTLDVDGNATDGETVATIWMSMPFGFPPFGWNGAAISADPAPTPWGLRVEVICGNATGYEAVTDAPPISTNASKFTQALCPAGKVPLGGGAQATSSSALLQDSVDAVEAAYGVDPGWAVSARGPATSSWNVVAAALCVDEAAQELASVYEGTFTSTGSVRTHTAVCPDGWRAVGGSVRMEAVNSATATAQARLTDHGPSGPPGAPNAWTGMARRPAESSGEWRIWVGVTCVPEPGAGALGAAAIAALASLSRRAGTRRRAARRSSRPTGS